VEGLFDVEECEFTVMLGTKITMWTDRTAQTIRAQYACPVSTSVAIPHHK